MSECVKTALELVLDEYRRRRGPDLPDQLELFAEAVEPDFEAAPTGEANDNHNQLERRGRGRPPGARNRRTDELGRFFVSVAGQGRDPFARLIYIAGLPILEPGVLAELAKTLGMEKESAARWWGTIALGIMPYLHQRLAQLTVLPAGTPGSGQPVLWSVNENDNLELAAEPGSRDGTTG
jgi:hypothetical protein